MTALAAGGADERHEIKFAAYATELPVIRQWLRLNNAGFVTSFPARQVNNLYFDGWDHRAYAENLAGISRRAKVRLRWYGGQGSMSAGALEVKRRHNLYGWKLRYPLAAAEWPTEQTWPELRAALRAELPLAGRLWLDQHPQPVILNRYRREYYVTADGAVRATIDVDQRVYDQRTGSRPNQRSPAAIEDTLVLELKFSRPDRQRAVKLLRDVPLRVSRHSKFMNGMRALALLT